MSLAENLQDNIFHTFNYCEIFFISSLAIQFMFSQPVRLRTFKKYKIPSNIDFGRKPGTAIIPTPITKTAKRNPETRKDAVSSLSMIFLKLCL